MDSVKKIRVLIADDHPPLREGLVRLLADEDDIEVVAQASDGEEAVELASRLTPDVAIIDVAMPKVNGIEATRTIKSASPETAVLIVSAYGHGPYVMGAIEAGASGYMLKNARVWEMVAAIRSVHAGETVLDPTAARAVFGRLSSGEGRGGEAALELHPRELEVIKLGARGMSNKEIAEALNISVRTVQTHFANIFGKLGVNSRTEAVVRAMKEGWLTTDDLA